MNRIPLYLVVSDKTFDEGVVENNEGLSVVRTARDLGSFALAYDSNLGILTLSTPDKKVFEVGCFPTLHTIGHGEAGVEGPRGSSGVDGAHGTVGAVGPAGKSGARGDQGSVGPNGPRGEEGYRGPMGRSGDKGSQGPRGYPGQPGRLGNPGYKGYAGNPIDRQMFFDIKDPGAIGPNNLWFQTRAKRFFNPHLEYCGGWGNLDIPIATASTTTTSTTSTSTSTSTSTTTTTTQAPIEYARLPIVAYNLIDGSPLGYPAAYGSADSYSITGISSASASANNSGLTGVKNLIQTIDGEPRTLINAVDQNFATVPGMARGITLGIPSNLLSSVGIVCGQIANAVSRGILVPLPSAYTLEQCQIICSIGSAKQYSQADAGIVQMSLAEYYDPVSGAYDRRKPNIYVKREGGSLTIEETGIINYLTIGSRTNIALLTGEVVDGATIPLPVGDFEYILTFLSLSHVFSDSLAISRIVCYADYDQAHVYAEYQSDDAGHSGKISGRAFYLSIGVP